MRKAYQSDLSDAEWSCLESHLPAPKATGRPKMHATREILNAIFYVVRGGCPWRLLPNDFPPWKTVYHYFRFWRLDGTWERMHSALPKRVRVRVRLKRNPQPSAAIVDSQSVKTTGVGGKERGATTGPRRSKEESAIFWWTPRGWCSKRGSTTPKSKTATALSSCSNPRGPASSRASAICGWTPATPEKRGAPAGWKGRWAGRRRSLGTRKKPAPEEVMMRWVREFDKVGLAIDPKRFVSEEGPRPFLPKRWVVERTFSWLGQNRRMSKDYERLPESSEAFIYAAMSCLMARRLARS